MRFQQSHMSVIFRCLLFYLVVEIHVRAEDSDYPHSNSWNKQKYHDQPSLSTPTFGKKKFSLVQNSFDSFSFSFHVCIFKALEKSPNSDVHQCLPAVGTVLTTLPVLWWYKRPQVKSRGAAECVHTSGNVSEQALKHINHLLLFWSLSVMCVRNQTEEQIV